MTRAAEETWRARIRGCLLGGAIGDALGGPIEFENSTSIVASHPDGVRTWTTRYPGW
jgi:ADP-ribosylglycohydrolase